jgi:hypothetical protein
VNDDWRLRVTLQQREHAAKLAARLEANELETDLLKSLHDKVVVSRDDDEVFCYAGTREQAEAAEQRIRELSAGEEWEPEFELKHWHPAAEQWEDPDTPLPATDADRAAEHHELIERERAESQASGHPEYEVRIEFRSHHDAVALAEKLRQEGVPSVHRSKYLLVGAPDEDSAQQLANRLRAEAPDGATVTAEGTVGSVIAATPANPYAVFGGLGG